MAQNYNDHGAIRALSTYHETLSARLGAIPTLNDPEIRRIIGGTQAFSQFQSPLQNLEGIISNCESFMNENIAGRGGVKDEHVQYVRDFAGWLVSYRDCLQQHGDDVPLLQRYVRLVKEHVEGGKTPVEAAAEHPGFHKFETAITSMYEPEWLFEGNDSEPPARSRHPESDSDEVVWLNDYYGELLETRDLFKNAKYIFVHFAGWALTSMPPMPPLEIWEKSP